MVPTRKPLVDWPQFITYLVLCFIAGTSMGGANLWVRALVIGLLLVVVRYFWCSTAAYGPAKRLIEPGDPKPFQFMRWMDIVGPSHQNGQHEELYLRRLYIVRTKWFGCMLHWIKREDWDRDALHDHPWIFWRFIVSGGYIEELAYPHQRGIGEATHLQSMIGKQHKLWRASKFPTGAYHRITSVKPHTVSFVINGPKSNSWGFFVPGTGKIPWRDYVNGAR